MGPILVLYYSRHGSTKRLADAIAQGAMAELSSLEANAASPSTGESFVRPEIIVRSVASLNASSNGASSKEPGLNNQGSGEESTNVSVEESNPNAAPTVTLQELERCSALALGSPTRFGNMAAPVKYFLDSTSSQWLKGSLINKPACVFTSSSSMHGGQESTLLSMMIPLFHHGMVMCGLPYSEPALHETRSGGSPYGVSHVALDNAVTLTEDEKSLCIAQGKRLAKLANALWHANNPETTHGA
ncbi:NAD(P)H-dependent oxidoreductase [Alteromonas stellipolaris]|uniref:NAD(P)H-dependent oxidoreductase n=1 Tax=Alteromonas stellipolaris TaxID=233316 RepID=A0AAW7YYT8_9ALTE|nr:NAD(P)H-dependent oxidoreductase [Alteromonas stellipolaris]MDO6575910.1 NAD(P)H-dependent oxidoreductase [Alteromonas stellipolaris]